MQCVENLLQNTDAIASTPKAFFASGAISARYAAGFTAFLFLDERCCPKKFRITKRIYPGLVQTTPSKCSKLRQIFICHINGIGSMIWLLRTWLCARIWPCCYCTWRMLTSLTDKPNKRLAAGTDNPKAIIALERCEAVALTS